MKMANCERINAAKLQSFMMGLESVGFELSKLEMKSSKNYIRFGLYQNDKLVATYDERKCYGWFDRTAARCNGTCAGAF